MQKRMLLVALALVASYGTQAAEEAKVAAAPKVFELNAKVTDGARTVVSYTAAEDKNEVVVGIPAEVTLSNSCVKFAGQLDTLVRVHPNHYTHQIRLVGFNEGVACATVIRFHKTLITVSLTLPKTPVDNTIYYRDVLIGNNWVRASYKHVVVKPQPAPGPTPAPVPAPVVPKP